MIRSARVPPTKDRSGLPPDASSRRAWTAIVVWTIFLRAPYVMHEMYDLDEGCYAAVAAAMVDGGVEYRDATDLKFPGIYWTYAAVFYVFGRYAMHAVHAAALLFTLGTARVLARFGREAGGRAAGFWAPFFYVSLTTLFPANLAANCELFMNLPYAWAAYGAWRAVRAETSGRALRWAFAAGACAASAMIYKQIGAVVGVVGIGYFLTAGHVRAISLGRTLGQSAAFIAGFALPTALMIGYLVWRGAYDDFVFWTITYLARYLSFSSSRLSYGLHFATCFLPFLFCYGAAWLPAIGWLRSRIGPLFSAVAGRRLPGDPQALSGLLVLWLVLSVAATLSGSRMYPHYWLQHLPPLSLIGALAVTAWGNEPKFLARRRRVMGATVVPCLGSWIWAWAFIGETPPALFTPEPDYRPAVEYVRRTTPPTDRLFVWGWFTPLYVHTGLTPGTRFVNTQMFVTYRPEHVARDPQKWVTNAALTWVEVAEAWPLLEEDFARRPPELILDTSPGNHHRFALFPMSDFPRLKKIVDERYRYETTVGGVGIYRRK